MVPPLTVSVASSGEVMDGQTTPSRYIAGHRGPAASTAFFLNNFVITWLELKDFYLPESIC